MSRLSCSTCSFLLLACLTAHIQAQPVVQSGEMPVAFDATQARFTGVNLRFERLTTDDGLPDNSVSTLLQDHLGFIWIGTDDGLARYDGLTTTVFQDDPDDPFSFRGTQVSTLMEDRAGDLWIGTTNTGLIHYERASGRFTTYANDPADVASLSHNDVSYLHEDQRGDLWVVTDRESFTLDRFNRATGTFTRFRHDPDDPGSLGSDTVDGETSDTAARRFAFYEDRSGTIWVGTEGGGLNRFDAQTQTFKRYQHDADDPASLSHNDIQGILEDRAGQLWLATLGGGLNRFDPRTETFTAYRHDPDDPFSVASDGLFGVYEDRHGALWITLGSGLDRLDPDTGTFTHFPRDDHQTGSLRHYQLYPVHEDDAGLWFFSWGDPPGVGFQTALHYYERATGRFTVLANDPEDPGSLSRLFFSFLKDRSGTVWVGSLLGEGLNKLDDRPRFPRYAFDSAPSDTDSWVNSIYSLYEAPSEPGVLWIGSNKGLARLDRATGRYTHYRHDPYDPHSLGDHTRFGGGGDDQYASSTSGLLEDQNGRFWVNTLSGLHLMDRESGRFTRFNPAAPDSFLFWRDQTVLAPLIETQDGAIWMGDPTRGGLSRFDPKTQLFTRHTATTDTLLDKNDKNRLSDSAVTVLYEDGEGLLWIGTRGGGLNRFDPTTETFTTFMDPRSGPLSVSALHEDRAGRLWMGDLQKGLHLIDRERGAIRHYGKRDGLPSNSVGSILEDDEGLLWLGTGVGLTRFDPEAETFRTYDEAYGLQHLRSGFKNADGTLLYSSGAILSGDGITVVDLNLLADDPIPPEVVLTGFDLFNAPAATGTDAPLQADVSVAEQITLAHDENDFTFRFAALHFSRPEENTVAYRLEPYEADWVAGGLARSARYTNLSPGTYTFRVKAANADGVWNEAGASIRISIAPPWWRTTGAYLLYGLLFFAGVFVVDRLQRKRLLRQERERTQARELEQAREIEKAYTQLKSTQAQLIQSEKMASLGQLTAGIAHEIKNPLNFINNFAEVNEELADEIAEALAAGEDVGPILADLKQNAAVIAQHGKRADGIVHAMMQHASGGTTQREATDINALVTEHIELAYHGKRAQMSDLQVTIRRDFAPDAGTVDVVPQEIGRVFLNLLGNAFDAVHAHALSVNGQYEATVTVTIERRDNAVEIRVKDNGPGIPAEIREKIFEPFFTTKPTGSGTGLGLSLSYDIVTQGHGGTLTVGSEEGEGATFIVTLPVNQTESAY